jgi:hypothetical protein
LLTWLTMILSNFIFKGCLITQLEYKLTKENTTIVDPILRLLKYKNTGQNRLRITMFLAFINVFVILFRIINT